MSSRPNLTTQADSDWRPHKGTTCPVDPETIVRVQFGFAVSKHTYAAKQLNWAGHNADTAITAYRVLEVPQ